MWLEYGLTRPKHVVKYTNLVKFFLKSITCVKRSTEFILVCTLVTQLYATTEVHQNAFPAYDYSNTVKSRNTSVKTLLITTHSYVTVLALSKKWAGRNAERDRNKKPSVIEVKHCL